MKQSYTSALERQRNNWNSEILQVVLLRRRRRWANRPEKVWPRFLRNASGIIQLTTREKDERKMECIMCCWYIVWTKKYRKQHIWQRGAFPSSQCTSTHLCSFDGKNLAVNFLIVYTSTVFIKLGSLRLFSVSKHEEIAQYSRLTKRSSQKWRILWRPSKILLLDDLKRVSVRRIVSS